MLRKLKILLIGVLALSLAQSVMADGDNPSERLSVSGYVKDAENGESLIGATVSVKNLKSGTATNLYGFFSISLKPGDYVLEFSYIGYAPISKKVELTKSISLTVELLPMQKQLEEVVITTERPDANVRKAEMSVAKLDMKTIKKVPAFMGEVDVIKVIQMLPGVIPTAEGTSGYSVRGGGMDQNLILIDEATVYNASHLMGFFSVFNNDAVRDVKLYKGDIPSNYGGRLSSVLDVRMKEGNNKKFAVTGGVGLISSRLTIEGPIINEKTSFLISGRRTYADMFFPLLSDSDARKTKMYFYDLNMKINHQLNANNRLYLSVYAGRDNFGQKGSTDAGYGNMTGTLRWNHQYSSRLFSNVSAIVAKYDYSLKMTFGGSNFVWNSEMRDYSLKIDYNYFLNPENEIKFGGSTTYHYFDPCNLYQEGKDSSLSATFPKSYALEHGVYISNEQKLGEKLILKYGLRYTIFQNIGTATIYSFEPSKPNYIVKDSLYFNSGKIFNTFQSFEPRLGLIYTINGNSSIKASYSRTTQYMQLASNSSGGLLLDIWFPSSPNVMPQKANQYAIGYFRNFKDNIYETSVEAYYKDMYNVIDFKDNAQLLQNPKLEREVRKGTARAYGIEFLIRKNEGRLNGWISYTLSSTKRKIPEINNGVEYSAPYDKPNNVSVIVNYEITKRMTISANWIYATGAPITLPSGTYEITGPQTFSTSPNSISKTIGKTYSTRNGSRMPDYHRLDLSLSLKGKERPGRLWQGEWVFSLYNAYGRHNSWMINFIEDNKKPGQISMQNWYLPFLYFPGITYNFKF